MEIIKKSNASLKLLTVLSISLLLGSSLALEVKSGNGSEAKFRSFDVDSGLLKPMTLRFNQGKFSIDVEEEEIDGQTAYVAYLNWTPAQPINLCYTDRNDRIMPGDLMYIYDPSLNVPELAKPLQVPLYASRDASKTQPISAAPKYMNQKIPAVVGAIAGDKKFAKAFPNFAFKKLKMKPWAFAISLEEYRGMQGENAEVIKAVTGGGENPFLTPPEGTHVAASKEDIISSFTKAVERLLAEFDPVYNPQNEVEQKGLEGMKGLVEISAKKIIKMINENASFWDNIDSLKAQVQTQFFLPVVNGAENMILTALRGPMSSEMNKQVDGLNLLNGAAKNLIIDEHSSLEHFPMLQGLADFIDAELLTLNGQMDSAGTRRNQSSGIVTVDGLTGLKLKLKGVFDGVVTKSKFSLVNLSFNQISAMKVAFDEYVKVTQAMHPDMEIYDENAKFKINLKDFTIAYWEELFANPQFYGFSVTQPPYLVGDRRRLII